MHSRKGAGLLRSSWETSPVLRAVAPGEQQGLDPSPTSPGEELRLLSPNHESSAGGKGWSQGCCVSWSLQTPWKEPMLFCLCHLSASVLKVRVFPACIIARLRQEAFYRGRHTAMREHMATSVTWELVCSMAQCDSHQSPPHPLF